MPFTYEAPIKLAGYTCDITEMSVEDSRTSCKGYNRSVHESSGPDKGWPCTWLVCLRTVSKLLQRGQSRLLELAHHRVGRVIDVSNLVFDALTK